MNSTDPHHSGGTLADNGARGHGRIVAIVRAPYEYLVLYASLLFFAASSALFTLIGVLLYPFLPRCTGARVGRRIMTGLCRIYIATIRASGLVRCDLSALDALAGCGPLIIAANHPALIDIILICERLDNIVCIMKANIRRNPLFGGARLAGYISNDPIGSMVRTSVEELEQGSQLLIFPEGTRTVTPPVNEFKSAFGLIARKSRVPVQTVFIEASSPFLGKGWPLWKKPQFPLAYRVTLGERFEAGEDAKQFVQELEDYYRTKLAEKTGQVK